MKNLWQRDHLLRVGLGLTALFNLALSLQGRAIERDCQIEIPALAMGDSPRGNHRVSTLTLRAVEQRCLTQSHQLRASRLRESAAHHLYLQSVGALLPSLNYQEQFGVQKGQRGFTRQITLAQALYSNSALATKALQKTAWISACLETVALENNLLFSTRREYLNCVLARVTRQVAEDQIALLRKSLRQEQKRCELGVSTSFEVNQAKVALANAHSNFYESCRAEKTAIDQLASLIGIPVEAEHLLQIGQRGIDIAGIPLFQGKIEGLKLDLDPLLGDLALTEGERDRAPSEERFFPKEQIAEFERLAVNYQPELRIARLGLISALQNLQLQRSGYYPQVAASLSSANSARPSRSILGGGQKLSGAITLNWTLLDGFAREQGVQRARLEWRAAKFLYTKQQNDVALQVHQQLHAMEQSLLANWVSERGVELAQQGLELAQHRYDNGSITSLDFRRAANDLVKARLAREQASFTAATSYYQIVATCALECRKRLDDLGDFNIDVD